MIIEERGSVVSVALPHFGHELRASLALKAVLSAFGSVSSSVDSRDIDQRVIDLLADYYILLRSSEAQSLCEGLTICADPTAGRSYAPRALGKLASGSICLFGAPLDTAVLPPFSPAHGPQCIRREIGRLSAAGRPFRLSDLGDIVRWPDDGLRTLGARIHHLVKRILHAECLPLMLGGDHAASFFALRAIAAREKAFAVLHLDAHADLGELPQGRRPRSPLNHANVMGYALELPGLAELVQVGVRKPPSTERLSRIDGVSIRTVSPSEFRQKGPRAIVDMLPPLPLYLSVDLDVLDPKLAPEVTTPLDDGLTFSEVEGLVRASLISHTVIGLDFVEVCAVERPNNQAARFAAELVGLVAEHWRTH